GAFGLVVLDLTEGVPAGSDAWQGRLLGLGRQHHSRLVMLTEKTTAADSLGPLVGLRIEPRRTRVEPGRFVVEHHVLKNKSGAPLRVVAEHFRGPWGLAGSCSGHRDQMFGSRLASSPIRSFLRSHGHHAEP